MSSVELENLVRTGQLKVEPFAEREFDGLVKSGRARLADARKKTLALESRFDLAYNGLSGVTSASTRPSVPQRSSAAP